MTSVAEYLTCVADDIDYASLDLGLLRDLALQREEPFIATLALGELAMRGGRVAGEAAGSILGAALWDRYLHAFAVKVLYGADPVAAIAVMNDLLPVVTIRRFLLQW